MNDLPSYSGGFTVVGEARDSLSSSLQEIWRYRPLIAELVRRDLKVRYKNRVGGVLWSLFPPLLQVLTITVMVKLFIIKIENYSAYLLTALFFWQFFQNIVLDASQSMLNNAALVRKIYFPRAILPIVTLISNLIHFSVSLSFTFLYFFVFPLGAPVFPQNLGVKALMIFPAITGIALLALGIGYFLAFANTLYEDVRYLITTFLGLFFYALPILYPIERVAAQSRVYSLYMANPIAAWLVAFQRALLPPVPVDGAPLIGIPWNFVALATVSTLLIFLAGFGTFERSKWAMMERL